MVVLITVGSRGEAEKISSALVDEGLAACINIMGPVTSVYKWKGRIERAEEHLLIVKTVRDRLEELKERVKILHSYSLPEIIALRIEDGSTQYLKWLEECSGGSNEGQD